MDEADLAATVDAARSLIREWFEDEDQRGAAAILLDDGPVVADIWKPLKAVLPDY